MGSERFSRQGARKGRGMTGREMFASFSILAGMVLVLLTGPTGAVASPATVSCASGRTTFREHGVRIVVVAGRTHFGGGQDSPIKTFYVCPRGAKRGREFRESTPFTREQVADFRVFGGRIGFVANSEGVQSGGEEQVGWVQVSTARSKSGSIDASSGVPLEQEVQEEKDGAPPLPRVPNDHVNYVIAGDGTVAVAGSGPGRESLTSAAEPPEEWEVCLLTVKPHGLSFPKKLFRTAVKAEAVDLDSLAISETAVTWSLVNGQSESAERER
jgi:hypothetical protein